MRDHRVHVCLYFIQPSGHGLKPLDIEFMKRLHDKVNIIPVLAKADTMTPDECTYFKKQVSSFLKNFLDNFPLVLNLEMCLSSSGSQWNCSAQDQDLRVSRRWWRGIAQISTRPARASAVCRGRLQYSCRSGRAEDSWTTLSMGCRRRWISHLLWKIIISALLTFDFAVENMEHCDFIALRNMLIRTHMTDLKEVTNNVHYENFRCRKLAGVGVTASDGTLGKSNRISNKLVSFFVDLFPDFFRCHFETQNVILSQKMKRKKESMACWIVAGTV